MTISLKLDHVTIAGSDLGPLTQQFTAIGLPPDYGGPHSNGSTHMALLGFEDGSYVELISTIQPKQQSPWWDQQIAQNGGPCAWAVQVSDISAEAQRMAALGVPVQGPTYYSRQRPDGALVEWDLAFIGDQPAGAVLPFLIQDRTPRAYRVQPAARLGAYDEAGQSRSGQLKGIAAVVIAVKDLAGPIELFRRLYQWSAPELQRDPDFGAELAYFVGSPVGLATPLSDDNWLADRVRQFGESPCAYLLSTAAFVAAVERYQLRAETAWFERRVAWFDPAQLGGTRLGVINDYGTKEKLS